VNWPQLSLSSRAGKAHHTRVQRIHRLQEPGAASKRWRKQEELIPLGLLPGSKLTSVA